MKYYIVKKGDTIDKILKNYGLTYQYFISLNEGNVKDLFKEGNKIKIGNIRNDGNYKTNINKIYQEEKNEKDIDEQYICPYCKNIIVITKQ